MFYLHEFDNVRTSVWQDYDRIFFYRWCHEAFTALADHEECTKDYGLADFTVASSTLRCVSFATVDKHGILQNLAALALNRPHKKILCFDLTDLPSPNLRGEHIIVCKSAYHERFYSADRSIAIPQFPRYQFEDTDVRRASERPYLAGFKGDPRPGQVMLRSRMLALNNDVDLIIKPAVLTPGHIKFLPSGQAIENTPPGEWSYADILRNSAFALLPRACGYALSYRMVESMNLGCVPVIISDGYVLPFSETLNYDNFSIRIAEDDIDRLPDILRERRRDADTLQAESLRVYHEYFSSTAKIIGHTLAIASRLQ